MHDIPPPRPSAQQGPAHRRSSRGSLSPRGTLMATTTPYSGASQRREVVHAWYVASAKSPADKRAHGSRAQTGRRKIENGGGGGGKESST